MAGKTSRASAQKRSPKAEGGAEMPPGGLPDEPEAAGADRGDDESGPPSADGTRVAVLGRSIVPPRPKR